MLRPMVLVVRVWKEPPLDPVTTKRLLARHGYPPDAQPGATELVLQQMETFAEEWSPDAGH
jgi:Domain of unknown function (DUF3387)